MNLVDLKDEEKNNDNKTINIPLYVFLLVLPKCVMVYGESIATIYLQIVSNINKDEKNINFFDRCWLKQSNIAKLTGYHKKTVKKSIQILESLKLIKTNKVKNIQTYRLNSLGFVDDEDIWNYVGFVDNHILSSVSFDVEFQKRSMFMLINKSAKSFFPDLNKNISLDLTDTRKKLLVGEKIYKGSSLFYLNLMLEKELFHQSFLLKEQDRGLFVGSSQSTISRYIKAYENSGLIVREKSSKTHNIGLIADNKINFGIDENKIKKVVSTMLDVFCCPVCNEEFDSKKAIAMHIVKSKDNKHKDLNEIKKTNGFDIIQLIEHVNTQGISNTKKTLPTEKPKDNYMSIECKCKITCRDCHLIWEEEFHPCDHKRKYAYIKEYNVKINSAKKSKKDIETVKEIDFQDIDVKKDETASHLLKHFYDQTKTKGPNFAKEGQQIKNALKNEKLNISYDEMKDVLSFMYKKGHVDLKFLNSSISEYRQHNNYMMDLKREGTATYLLSKYYDGIGLPVNMQNLIKEVEKIQYSISCEGYENTKMIVEYMVNKKISNINYIGNVRNEAYLNRDKKSKNTSMDSFKKNPAFFDQDDINFIHDELMSGRKKISDINEKHKDEAISIAKKLIVDKKINNKYSVFEWSWKVGFDLDYETYRIACDEEVITKYFDYLISTTKDEDKLSKITNKKVVFENWVEKQHLIFSEFKQKI